MKILSGTRKTSRRDAEVRGIGDGDHNFVETPRGRVVSWAQVNEDIVPGAVEVNMGGGGPLGAMAWREVFHVPE